MADQLATASKLRLIRRLGVLPPEDLGSVVRAICVQLDL
jgi:hypothetical protein